jgi:UDP:flavonoid glycosyltransferase YjiC (YdhE family)
MMSRFLLATTPVPGHTVPVSVLARALVERGHDVGWYTGAAFAGSVEATGATHFPVRPESDWSLRHPHDAVPELRTATGLAQVRLAFTRLFIDSAPGALADLESVNAQFHADVVVANSLVLADAWMRERGGPVNARVSTTMYGLYSRDTAPFGLTRRPNATLPGRVRNAVMNTAHRKIAFGRVNRHLDDVRASVGLPRLHTSVIDSFMSPYLWLQDTVPSFEYPRSDLPAQVHFIGPLLPEPSADFVRPAWWGEVTGPRPVVLVTQGTVRNEDVALFDPAIKALADLDVQVVLSTGRGALTLPDHLPSNIRVVDYVPFVELMPHVDAYVTNGGYGGVQMALANGVPIVVAGATEDKPEVGARVAWSGAGIRLPGKASASAIRRAVQRVLHEDRYRTNARRLAAEVATYDAGRQGAELLEQLAVSQAPVLRAAAAVSR